MEIVGMKGEEERFSKEFSKEIQCLKYKVLSQRKQRSHWMVGKTESEWYSVSRILSRNFDAGIGNRVRNEEGDCSLMNDLITNAGNAPSENWILTLPLEQNSCVMLAKFCKPFFHRAVINCLILIFCIPNWKLRCPICRNTEHSKLQLKKVSTLSERI